MVKPAKSKRPRLAATQRPPPDAGQSHWPRVLILLIGVAGAALLVERGTRPREKPPPESSPQKPASTEPGRPRNPVPLVAATATTEQLVAAGRQLAGSLAEAFPQDPQALTQAGQLRFALGDATQAVTWWEQSVALNPRLAEAWCGLALDRWERGDFEQAIACMQRVQEANPQLADQRIYVRVDALLNLGREAEAIRLLESRAQVSALSTAGSLTLGQAYLQAEDYENARRQFEAVLAAAPSLANAHYGLATALAELGQAAQAQHHRAAYTRLKQQDLAAWDRLRGSGRQVDKASPAEVRGLLAGFCLAAGKLYALHGEWQQAATHWRQALTLDSQNPEPRQLLATLPSGQG